LGQSVLISAALALVAWWARTLTTSGAVAATAVGMLILHGTGWQGGAVLAAFFVSSNLISRIGTQVPLALDAKGDRRDAWQVVANGGAAAIGAGLGTGRPWSIWVVSAALAAAAADTWATAVGIRSKVQPRLVGFGRPVAAGTSGGMTLAGTSGGLVGAVLVGAVAAFATGWPILLPVATLIGFLGMVADSALGALLQGRYHCPLCDEASEWTVHRCGAATTREGGLAWLNNDGVNFVATGLAACTAGAAWIWLTPTHP
jgi:uncharacterized protein (TIGR00297 family)